MPDTLQRPRRDVAAAAVRSSGRPRARVRTAAGRDWAATPVQVADSPVLLVPRPRRSPESSAPQQLGEVSRPAQPVRHGRRAVRLSALLLLNVVLVTSMVAFVGLAIGPRFGHYQTLTMLTGSMRPEFPTGSVVVATRQPVETLRPGHVITYHAPIEDRRVVTHRVVSIDRSGAQPVVVTKGDANAGDDPWKAVLDDPYVWRARFAIPLLGDAIRALRQPNAQLITTRVIPGLVLVWLLVSIWRSEERGDESTDLPAGRHA